MQRHAIGSQEILTTQSELKSVESEDVGDFLVEIVLFECEQVSAERRLEPALQIRIHGVTGHEWRNTSSFVQALERKLRRIGSQAILWSNKTALCDTQWTRNTGGRKRAHLLLNRLSFRRQKQTSRNPDERSPSHKRLLLKFLPASAESYLAATMRFLQHLASWKSISLV